MTRAKPTYAADPKPYSPETRGTVAAPSAANANAQTAGLMLSLNNRPIRDQADLLSLTDMWKASGSDPSKQPAQFLRSKQAKDFAGYLETVGISHSLEKETGRGSQTFRHWQIALAYAKYLSPAFHAACNVVIRDKMQGRSAVQPDFDGVISGLDPKVAAQIGGIIKAVVGNQISVLLPQMVQAEIVAHQYVGVRGLTAGEVLDMAGVTDRKGLKDLAGFVSGKLRPYFAARNVVAPKATLGRSTAYVFDRALAHQWLKDGGRREIEMKIAEKRGQTVMRLVQA